MIVAPMVTTEERCSFSLSALLKLQSWISPAFPIGSYAYSHGIEWAVEARHVTAREDLVDWLESDLRYGSGRNEAIFVIEAWRRTLHDDLAKLVEIAELAAAFRATPEFALESSQQAAACMATLRQVWPDCLLDRFAESLHEIQVQPSLPVVFGLACARQRIPANLALAAFLQSYAANLVNAGVRLVPLGQTDGQVAIAKLEQAVLAVTAEAQDCTIDDLGSAALMVDLASMAHETQYTRLFRS
jgi:urease accessory protein